jgi:hypothetical protein
VVVPGVRVYRSLCALYFLWLSGVLAIPFYLHVKAHGVDGLYFLSAADQAWFEGRWLRRDGRGQLALVSVGWLMAVRLKRLELSTYDPFQFEYILPFVTLASNRLVLSGVQTSKRLCDSDFEMR